MDKRRLFLAIELPLDIQKQLAKKLKALNLRHVHLRPQQQWHVTLTFFGLVEEEIMPSLIRKIEEKLIGVTSFTLGVTKPGVFSHQKRAKHLWVDVSGDVERLTKIANLFHVEEDKVFVPHITVATVQKAPTVKEKQANVDKFMALKFKKQLWFEVREIVLFRSKLTRSNPIYMKIATFSLR